MHRILVHYIWMISIWVHLYQAGSTTLVTIDSIDPIFVEFSMTEQEYLDFMKKSTLAMIPMVKYSIKTC